MSPSDVAFVYLASAVLIVPGALIGLRAIRAFNNAQLFAGRLSTERHPAIFALLLALMFCLAGGLVVLGIWFPGEVVNLDYE